VRSRPVGILLTALVIASLGCALYGAALVSSGFSTRTPPSRLERVLATSMRSMAVPPRAKVLHNPAFASLDAIDEAKAH